MYVVTCGWSAALGVVDLLNAMLSLQDLLRNRFLDLSESAVFARMQDAHQVGPVIAPSNSHPTLTDVRPTSTDLARSCLMSGQQGRRP